MATRQAQCLKALAKLKSAPLLPEAVLAALLGQGGALPEDVDPLCDQLAAEAEAVRAARRALETIPPAGALAVSVLL